MSATPERRKAGAEDMTITATCWLCGRDGLILHPVAVTVNVPLKVIQTMCGHCGTVTDRPAHVTLVAALLAAGSDYVPAGIDDATKAWVLAGDVYGLEPVPQWPAGGAA